jgi:hypothetical protein
MVPQQAIVCTDCGKEVDFHYLVGFCRICGGPLCSECAQNTQKYLEAGDADRNKYILYKKFTRKILSNNVALCRGCYKTYTDRIARRKFWAIAGCLSLLSVFLAAFVMTGLVNMVILSLVMTGLLLVSFIYALDVETENDITPICPVCRAYAGPFLLAQTGYPPQMAVEVPDTIRCVCGYCGPRALQDGLSKFVDSKGPAMLNGTPLQTAGYHSWYLRHMYRRT